MKRSTVKRRKILTGSLLMACAAVLILSLVMIAGCTEAPQEERTDSGSGETETITTSLDINVVSREEGSGTRSAFVELFEVEKEDSSGEKVDATTTNAIITNSTSVALTTVSGDPAAIGYISLGSLNDNIKAVDIDGIAATAENVKSGAYAIQRPFNIATKEDPDAAAEDFINFIMSSDGQKIIEENNYITANENASAYEADEDAEGKVVVAGSSSVSPVMEKLIEAYKEVNSKVTVEIQTNDSSTGIMSTIDDICDIGMASRELKDSELSEGLKAQVIAIDGIAIIVNKENKTDDLTQEQVRDIYLGEITKWEDIDA